MKACLIKDGEVKNIIVIDSLDSDLFPEYELVEPIDRVTLGTSYMGGEFVLPPLETEEPE